jgi:hypothetical protein
MVRPAVITVLVCQQRLDSVSRAGRSEPTRSTEQEYDRPIRHLTQMQFSTTC